MITVPALGRSGRLGNQMFQYAALLGIADRLGFEATVPPPARHELGRRFPNLSSRVHSEAEVRDLRHQWVESSLAFDVSVEAIQDSTGLFGYFQSQSYFPARATIQREFRFADESLDRAQRQFDTLRRRSSCIVGVAVRLGDFVGNPEMLSLPDSGYYDRAMSRLRERHGGDVVFVVSSDDPAACRQRLVGRQFIHLADLLDSDIDQLAFLTLTDELIIANSTFAWWAGYLGADDRRVINASRWYTEDGTYPESEREHHPGWEEVEVAATWCGNDKIAVERRAHVGAVASVAGCRGHPAGRHVDGTQGQE